MPYIGPLLSKDDSSVAAGGAETQIMLLSRELATSGMSVALIVAAEDDLPESVDGVRVVKLTSWSALTGVRLIGQLLGFGGVLVACMRLRPGVLVQRMGSQRTGWCAAAARLTGTRFIWSSASRMDFIPRAANRTQRAAGLLRIGVLNADRVVVQTEEQKRLCKEVYGRESVLIPSLSQELSARGGKKTADAIWIGRGAQYKRPDAFLDLAEALPELSFRMILAPSDDLDGNMVAEVESRANDIGNLELLGPQTRSKVIELISQSRVLINTSPNEGMPNVFLEAWSLGVPTLALHHDPDGVISANGLGGIAGGSPELLAQLTLAACTDSSALSATASRCRSHVLATHDSKRVARKWRELLASE